MKTKIKYIIVGLVIITLVRCSVNPVLTEANPIETTINYQIDLSDTNVFRNN